jgi:hypothetical protein
MPLDDGHMTETSCGNIIRRGEELLHCFVLFICLIFMFSFFSVGTSAAASSSKVSLFDPSADLNKALAGSYLFQDETAGDDSLFSKPQKGLTPR